MTTQIDSYGKVHHLGTRHAAGAEAGPYVAIQEKVDGSQFSFGVALGVLVCRSKGRLLDLEAPPNLFAPAVTTCRRLHASGLLPEGRVYRGEAMKGPKHNLLSYERAPRGGLVLFDVDGHGPATLGAEGDRLGLEVVPLLCWGTPEGAQIWLARPDAVTFTSMLGGPAEGVVVKSYASIDGPLLARAKVVGETFREVRKSQGGRTRGGGGTPNPATLIATDYATPARYAKARQWLAEQGELRGDRSDIGRIVKRVQDDINEECAEEIGARLWSAQRKHILGVVGRGVAEWFGGVA